MSDIRQALTAAVFVVVVVVAVAVVVDVNALLLPDALRVSVESVTN